MNDDVGPVGQGPHQGRRGAGGVDDEGDAPLVGQVGDRPEVAERLLGIARGFHVKEPGVFIHLGGPVLDMVGLADPAGFQASLLALAQVEELERASVNLDGGDEIDLFAVVFPHEQGIDGHGDGAHPGGRDQARRVHPGLVAFEEGHRPFEVVGGRIGDPGVAPRGNQIGQGGFELVGVPIMLGIREEERLDDRALVADIGFFERVEAVNGDGVELPLLGPGDQAVSFGDELLRFDHVLHDSRSV